MALVPKSSGEIALALDRVINQLLTQIGIDISNSLDPERCRTDLLPWLAYHRGVDVWFSDWSVSQKRAVIRDATKNFRRRGTRTGLVSALDNLVSEVEILEWWQEAATQATFRVNVIGSALESISAQNAIADVVKRSSPYTRQGAVTVENQLRFAGYAAAIPRIALMINTDNKQPSPRP